MCGSLVLYFPRCNVLIKARQIDQLVVVVIMMMMVEVLDRDDNQHDEHQFFTQARFRVVSCPCPPAPAPYNPLPTK